MRSQAAGTMRPWRAHSAAWPRSRSSRSPPRSSSAIVDARRVDMQGMPLFPERASAFAADVDTLLIVWLAIAGIVVAGIAIAITGFVLRYRAGSAADRDRAPPKTLQRISRRIEIAWIVAPLVIFLAM